MGDRFATVDMGRKVGGVGAAVPLSVNEYQPNGGDAMWLGSKGR